jgi:hypothetical protein
MVIFSFNYNFCRVILPLPKKRVIVRCNIILSSVANKFGMNTSWDQYKSAGPLYVPDLSLNYVNA